MKRTPSKERERSRQEAIANLVRAAALLMEPSSADTDAAAMLHAGLATLHIANASHSEAEAIAIKKVRELRDHALAQEPRP